MNLQEYIDDFNEYALMLVNDYFPIYTGNSLDDLSDKIISHPATITEFSRNLIAKADDMLLGVHGNSVDKTVLNESLTEIIKNSISKFSRKVLIK